MLVLERHVQSKYTGKNLFGLLENDPKLKNQLVLLSFLGVLFVKLILKSQGRHLKKKDVRKNDLSDQRNFFVQDYYLNY